MTKKAGRSFRILLSPLLEVIDSRVLIFAMVGSVGFAVDASLTTVLTVKFGLDVLLARVVSFGCAVLVTWRLNRTFTFSHQASREPLKRRREYLLYFAVQVIGAAVNLAVFLALIEWNKTLKQIPAIPLACGSAVALIFNFAMSRKLVFVGRTDKK